MKTNKNSIVINIFLVLAFIGLLDSCNKENSARNSSVASTSVTTTEAVAVGVSATDDSIYVIGTCARDHHLDSISITSLPAIITDYLEGNYAGYTFQKAYTDNDSSGNISGYVVIIQFNGKPVGLKFDASGNLLYSTFLGGTNDDAANSVVVNADGSVYVGGWTRSGDFPVTSGAYQKTYGGGMDAFLVKISNDGSQLLYSTFLGGSGDEQIQNLLLNADGSLWIGGDASAAGLIPSANAAQKAPAGNDNMFFAKAQFDQNGAL